MNLNRKTVIKGLLVFVAVFCIFVLIYPFLPQIIYWLKYEVFDYDWTKVERIEISSPSSNEKDQEDSKITDKRLIIPVIGVDVQIVEGGSDDALNLGAWHRPNTGNPLSGGNMVITGHRFQYLPPNNLTFYHLDKLEEGDEIIVYWNEIEYDYLVSETFVVEPSDVEIEEQTATHIVTLYTCTPLWTADKRLVVRAEPNIN